MSSAKIGPFLLHNIMRDLEGDLETKRKRKYLHAKGNPSLKKLNGVNLEDFKQLGNFTSDGQLELTLTGIVWERSF